MESCYVFETISITKFYHICVKYPTIYPRTSMYYIDFQAKDFLHRILYMYINMTFKSIKVYLSYVHVSVKLKFIESIIKIYIAFIIKFFIRMMRVYIFLNIKIFNLTNGVEMKFCV